MHSKDLNVVFYCKGCTEMIFATSNDPENMIIDKDAPRAICELLEEGHQMALVTDDEVRNLFYGCSC